MGGADANGDGRITYDELKGFVGVASPPSPTRPYARTCCAGARTVTVPRCCIESRTPAAPARWSSTPGHRFIMRNGDGFRLAELHTEENFAPTVRLWGGADCSWRSVRPAAAPDQRPARLTYDLPESGSLRLRDLSPRPPSSQVRGGDRMFQALFERPFGPRALARQLAEERAGPSPIFGLSRADTDRLRLNLDLLAKTKRDDRLGNALWQGLVATALGAAAVDAARGNLTDCGADCPATAWALGSMAAVFGALTVNNLMPGPMERLADGAGRSMGSGGDPAVWLPPLGEDLDRLAARTRLRRRIFAGVVGGLLGLGAIAQVADVVHRGSVTGGDAWGFGLWTVLAGTTTWLLLQESTSERQIRALKADPLWQGIAVAVAPTPGGLRLALDVRF